MPPPWFTGYSVPYSVPSLIASMPIVPYEHLSCDLCTLRQGAAEPCLPLHTAHATSPPVGQHRRTLRAALKHNSSKHNSSKHNSSKGTSMISSSSTSASGIWQGQLSWQGQLQLRREGRMVCIGCMACIGCMGRLRRTQGACKAHSTHRALTGPSQGTHLAGHASGGAQRQQPYLE